jgi:hypothetical protein
VGLDVGGQQQQRIVGQFWQGPPQAGDNGADGIAVRLGVARQRSHVLGMALAANQPHRDIALRNSTRLAHLAAIHADEVRLLGFERGRIALARLQRSVDRLGQR